jgi:predicted nucleic acid-binding protein
MIVAVLDADVLYPMVLRDSLLRAAAAGCFRLHWSGRILDEVMRNLTETYGMEPTKAAALREAMTGAFPEAEVTGWEPLEAEMANHPKDRHVAAAAATIGADIIVTSNVRDFKDLPRGMVAMTPDQFLVHILATAPEGMIAALRQQSAAYRRPPVSTPELLHHLSTVAPSFATEAAKLVGDVARQAGDREQGEQR